MDQLGYLTERPAEAVQRPADEEVFDDPVMCSSCNGSGQGMYDGWTCWSCNGRGVDKSSETQRSNSGEPAK